jgi:hypothetical protein
MYSGEQNNINRTTIGIKLHLDTVHAMIVAVRRAMLKLEENNLSRINIKNGTIKKYLGTITVGYDLQCFSKFIRNVALVSNVNSFSR